MLRSSCTLQRQASTKAGGGPSASYANVQGAVNVPCNAQPAGADVVWRFLQRGLVVNHSVFLAQDIAARATDHLVMDDGRVFQLVEGGYEQGGAHYPQWPAVAHTKEVVGP